jgi:hypothetical protein
LVACQRFGAGFATREALEATAFPPRTGLAASAGGSSISADAINASRIFFKAVSRKRKPNSWGKIQGYGSLFKRILGLAPQNDRNGGMKKNPARSSVGCSGGIERGHTTTRSAQAAATARPPRRKDRNKLLSETGKSRKMAGSTLATMPYMKLTHENNAARTRRDVSDRAFGS